MIPPIGAAGPTFAIRVPPKRIYTLDEYVENGDHDPGAGRTRSGKPSPTGRTSPPSADTSSGKTTLLNAILAEAGYAAGARSSFRTCRN